MKKDHDIYQIFKIACLYISTIIGAGFASGREILTYFTTYGLWGYVGIVFSAIIIGLIGAMILLCVKKFQSNDLDTLLLNVAGKIPGRILFALITIFLFFFYSIMIAGIAKLVTEKIDLNWALVSIVVALLTVIIVMLGVDKLAVICTFLAPLLAISISICAIFSLTIASEETFYLNTDIISKLYFLIPNNWIFSSIVYAGYNCLISTSVLSKALPMIKSRKIAIYGGILGGAGIGFLALIVNTSLYFNFTLINTKEMPLAYIVMGMGAIGGNLFPVLLIIAMLLASISALLGLTGAIEKITKINGKIISISAAILAVPLSLIGFSSLMDNIYPIFSYAGIFLALMLIMQIRKKCKKQTLMVK